VSAVPSSSAWPWSFPPEPHRRLLARCGVSDPLAWAQLWSQRVGAWEGPPHPSLLWGLVLPLLSGCHSRLSGEGSPLLIGLNGPVGAGKTTLGQTLERLAPSFGLRLAVVSIDDAYLPYEQRLQRLAGNPFGVSRVPPGSHDLPLLLECLRRWRSGEPLQLPRFDKRLRAGLGDRAGWRRFEAVDVLVLEGWLVGCRALGESALSRAMAQPLQPWSRPLSAAELAWLPRWDRELQAYQPLWDQLDGLWLLRPKCWNQRRCSGQALQAVEVAAMAQATLASLPPEIYQEPLAKSMPGCSDAQALIRLDGQRRCIWSGPAEEAV
jgi:D-glycerate 3-kinase